MATGRTTESSSDVTEASWLDSLPSKRLFSHLREKGSSGIAGGNVMCTIKENLFVWSREELALLTVNLKRLCATPTEDIFQVCACMQCSDTAHTVTEVAAMHVLRGTLCSPVVPQFLFCK